MKIVRDGRINSCFAEQNGSPPTISCQGSVSSFMNVTDLLFIKDCDIFYLLNKNIGNTFLRLKYKTEIIFTDIKWKFVLSQNDNEIIRRKKWAWEYLNIW